MNSPKLIALSLVLAVAVTPTLSFAKASGGGSRGGGGYSKGSPGSGSFGSRGTRTYDNNKFKPIERSNTPATGAVPPTARPAVPAAPAQPASPAPFWQRHPILTGLAAGFAGSWIGHMLFGADNTLAGSGETAAADQASDSGGSMFMFLLLMVLGAAAWYYFMKVRRSPSAAPAYPGFARNSVSQGDIAPPLTKSGFMSQPSIASALGPIDEDKFKEILRDVQAAWSNQDLDALKRLTTPEILHYFSGALSENVSQEVENHVDDLRVLSAEVQEAWTEDGTDYATVLLRWTARDYTVSLTKQQGESGFIVDGDDHSATETSEAWTFMRYRGGKWLLSAIQQVE